MVTFAIVIIIITLIALLRFGVSAEYSEDGFTLTARAGPASLRLMPREADPVKEKKKELRRAEKKRKRAEKEKQRGEPIKKKGGALRAFIDMVPVVNNTLSRVRRRLLIKKLTIHYTAAGDDPFNTAMSYGAANAVFSAITPVLENSFRIKRRDFSAYADFQADQQTIYVNAAFSLAVWEAAYIAAALFPIIIIHLRRPTVSTVRKEGKDNGKAPDQ